jgi:hypothetical protein
MPIQSSRLDYGRIRSSEVTIEKKWFSDQTISNTGRRQLVDTTFSVLKIRFGGDLKARKFPVQIKEIASKMIVCNIHKV